MKLPKSTSNWISITGFIIAVNSFILILVSFAQDLLTEHQNPYTGIFTYIILPAIMVIGLLLIPIGMLINRKKTHDPQNRWPVLDMNVPRQRQKLLVVSVFIFLFLMERNPGQSRFFELRATGSNPDNP